jgi:TolB-like protein
MPSVRFVFGSFAYDADRQVLTRDARPVVVNARGLALLRALLAADGKVVSKPELMDAAWPGVAVEESNLSVQIAILRKLLGPMPDGMGWIATVPRVGYRFVGEQAVRMGTTGAEGTNSWARTSIAVMPLGNVGGDPEQDYLVDGVTDDIIAALARFRWFAVASRGTSFAYKGSGKDSKSIGRELDVAFLLEGSLRRAGTRIRLSAQLVETTGGTTVWSEQYDVEEAEIFAVQDAIAERVAGAVEPELLKRDAMRVAHHTGNLSAWGLVRRGAWNFHKVTSRTHLEARRLFREACLLDDALAEAQFWRARVNAGLVAYGWSPDPESDLPEGLDAALRAIYLDGQNPYSHYGLAIISVYSNRLPQAVLASERAIDLSPGFALGHLVLGMAQLFAGNAAAATVPLDYGLRLNPHDPQNPVWFNLLALARLFAGDIAGSLETVRAAVKARPDSLPLAMTHTCCLVANGNLDDARRAARLAKSLPQGTPDALGPFRVHNPLWEQHLGNLLAQAD